MRKKQVSHGRWALTAGAGAASEWCRVLDGTHSLADEMADPRGSWAGAGGPKHEEQRGRKPRAVAEDHLIGGNVIQLCTT